MNVSISILNDFVAYEIVIENSIVIEINLLDLPRGLSGLDLWLHTNNIQDIIIIHIVMEMYHLL